MLIIGNIYKNAVPNLRWGVAIFCIFLEMFNKKLVSYLNCFFSLGFATVRVKDTFSTQPASHGLTRPT